MGLFFERPFEFSEVHADRLLRDAQHYNEREEWIKFAHRLYQITS